MKLLIKQRVFAWSDSYDVYDEYGNPEQELDALLLVIAIDAANCQR